MKIMTTIAAAALIGAGSMAGAATVSLSTSVAPEVISNIPGQDFQAELQAAGNTHLFSGPMTLMTSDAVTVTLSWVAAESGFQNSLLVNGTSVITETANSNLADFTTGALQGQTHTFKFAGGDLASVLSFEAYDNSKGTTVSFNSSQLEFGVFADSANLGSLKTFYLGLDDDGANGDDNHDDIIVRVDIAPVPLPASGLLLMAGLGGAFGLRRFRRSA